jgi:hypothetical protein
MKQAITMIEARSPLVRFVAGAMIASCTATMAAAAPAGDAATAYVVQPRDTLYDLARRYMLSLAGIAEVSKVNRITDPRRLKPGSTLAIPTALLRSEPLLAKVEAVSGVVSVQDQAGTTPRPLVIGTSLKEGAIVRTAGNAFLTLRFADGSRISLPSNTVVRIDAARHIALGDADDRRFGVEAGRSAFEVTPATRTSDRFEVRTPMAVAAVRGTEFRVGYRPDSGTSTLEVLDGRVAESGTTSAESAAVDAGMAALRTDAGTSSRLLPLQPAPDLDDPGKTQSEAATLFRIAAPLPANSYHFQLARDAGFVDSFAETTAADGTGQFTDVPNGTFFVKATAIDTNGIEGRPVVYSFDRQRSSLDASVSPPPSKGPRQFAFKWDGSGEGRFVYRFVLARDAALADTIVDQAGLTGNAITLTDLAPGTYYWQVSFVQSVGPKTFRRSLKVNELRIAAPR